MAQQGQTSILERLAFGHSVFPNGEEHREFQVKFLIVVMISAAVLTALLIVSSATGANVIDGRHVISMCVFTALSVVIWLFLRADKNRFLFAAWSYEILCLAEYLSVTLFVPLDELRVFWYATNVPGVFILLGKKPGWIITVCSVVAVLVANSYVTHPYSVNALATFSLGLIFFAFFFHYYSSRSISYYVRMRQANEKLAHLASHDSLTGVLNARVYYETCNRMIDSAKRAETPYAVLFVDLDHFKKINDTYGHATGDTVLKIVANKLASSIRASDVTGRVGGEEFSVFLSNSRLEAAIRVAENLRCSIEALQISNGNQMIQVTVSIGIACQGESYDSMETIQKRADEAMYEAKRNGRNRVSTFCAES